MVPVNARSDEPRHGPRLPALCAAGLDSGAILPPLRYSTGLIAASASAQSRTPRGGIDAARDYFDSVVGGRVGAGAGVVVSVEVVSLEDAPASFEPPWLAGLEPVEAPPDRSLRAQPVPL